MLHLMGMGMSANGLGYLPRGRWSTPHLQKQASILALALTSWKEKRPINPFFRRELGLLSFSAFPTDCIQALDHQLLPLGSASYSQLLPKAGGFLCAWLQ